MPVDIEDVEKDDFKADSEKYNEDYDEDIENYEDFEDDSPFPLLIGENDNGKQTGPSQVERDERNVLAYAKNPQVYLENVAQDGSAYSAREIAEDLASEYTVRTAELMDKIFSSEEAYDIAKEKKGLISSMVGDVDINDLKQLSEDEVLERIAEESEDIGYETGENETEDDIEDAKLAAKRKMAVNLLEKNIKEELRESKNVESGTPKEKDEEVYWIED